MPKFTFKVFVSLICLFFWVGLAVYGGYKWILHARAQEAAAEKAYVEALKKEQSKPARRVTSIEIPNREKEPVSTFDALKKRN
ncbi:hypothetical protein Emin_0646 [Elusimicrobium minutum Pei191]|uniref:Uncharacterized protein n=1 Tax=Elusimicrobium minutum (strain Pei191) TaxID=445932 RepID=B2KC74_ELUMP|nr:hypothetical protein [Elusimicrobium minutum]ACC98201.1 hypothetical protein Emin_0646 [Elusimicrobium minutum Pei191]